MSVYFCPARAGQVKSRLRLSGGLHAFAPAPPATKPDTRAGWNEGLSRARTRTAESSLHALAERSSLQPNELRRDIAAGQAANQACRGRIFTDLSQMELPSMPSASRSK